MSKAKEILDLLEQNQFYIILVKSDDNYHLETMDGKTVKKKKSKSEMAKVLKKINSRDKTGKTKDASWFLDTVDKLSDLRLEIMVDKDEFKASK